VRRIGLGLAVAVLCAATAFFRAAPRDRAPSRSAASAVRVVAPAGVAPAATPPAPAGANAPLSPALRDTDVDGELSTDSHGDLAVNPDVRRFFDYFLVASGDVAPEVLRARIVAEIERRLPESPAARAVDLLDRYLEYRRRAGALDDRGSPDYEARLTALSALRREVLGTEDAVALFGDDEDSVRAALERQRIASDPRLSEGEKARELADVEASLPEAERKARADAISAVQLLQDEQALRAQGASAEDIRKLREARVGPEAADRLEALDAQQASFQASLAQARDVASSLAANPQLSDPERTAALRAFVQTHFPQEEWLHAGALLGLFAN